MKRNWDVIRQILPTREAAPPNHRIGSNTFPGLDKALVFEHVCILTDAGSLETRPMPFPPAGRAPTTSSKHGKQNALKSWLNREAVL